jgi:hypothetical protein
MRTIIRCDKSMTLAVGQSRWRIDQMQIRILDTLASGGMLKSQLRDQVVGNQPTPNQQSILSRSTRTLIDRGMVQKERLKMSLTPRGAKLQAKLRSLPVNSLPGPTPSLPNCRDS